MSDFHFRFLLEIIEGDFVDPVNSTNMISITGARRFVKTYFLYYLINNLIVMVVRKNFHFIIFTKN
ncbi:MAG: hypothetical protein ACUVRG_09450 [Ignavibacterium sp.]|uniref:hypothetical protein n=1 Tax=Ignavibacterium sp. TaxID=2651167 RepID=UPI0040492C6B